MMTVTNLVFVIAPRVNAAGRMDDARKAVQLFIQDNLADAMRIAQLLHDDNTERKIADSSITEEALALIESNALFTNRKTTVVYKETWHKGVVGIVASRLIDTYYRPTIVLTKSGDVVAGSARSVSGFNLYEAVHACKEHLLGYGGHFAAAGMTLLPEKVNDFSAMFEEVVARSISPESLIPEIRIDTELHLCELTPSFYNILVQMEPFGPENMRPVFLLRNVTDAGSRIVKEQHIRFNIKQDNCQITGIGFNMAAKFALLQLGTIDITCTVDLNEYNNTRSLQLKVIDFRLSA
jgi:single-stranded-DNA-specific exonuclease